MYKNVLKQLFIGSLILYLSCFSANKSFSQSITINTPATYATTADKLTEKSEKKSEKPKFGINSPESDTAWKPVRRLWGLAFGDLYFDAHADAGNRGAETNYSGVPTYRNAFQFRRIYLGYDYDITKKFTAEIILASEPAANTGVNGTTTVQNGDNLVDGKMSFYIKNFDLRWKGVWSGTDFVIGEILTPAFPLLTEKIWGYRAIERTIADFHRTNAFDVGVALQGVFDPATKNYGYNVMIGNNSTASLLSAANANTGFYKAFYGDIYAKFLNQTLIFDLYADYMKTAPATAALGAQSRNMIKAFAAYTTPKITFGVEAYTQQITNGVTATANATGVNATVNAISLYSRGAIYKDKIGFFARYDSYNPDNDFNSTTTYTSNTNLAAYNPYYKEHFITAGLDFTPAKNIHFMPNIWYIKYTDQRDPSVAAYVADDHTLVYTATFYFIFGK
jgi:hypothetical protein